MNITRLNKPDDVKSLLIFEETFFVSIKKFCVIEKSRQN